MREGGQVDEKLCHGKSTEVEAGVPGRIFASLSMMIIFSLIHSLAKQGIWANPISHWRREIRHTAKTPCFGAITHLVRSICGGSREKNLETAR